MGYFNPFAGGDAEPANEPDSAQEAVQLFGTPYKPHVYPELAFKYCLLGATDVQLCELFDIAVQTLAAWRAEHPLFNRSIIEGRDMADAEVAHSLYRCATGYTREEVKIFQFQGVPVVVPFTQYYAPDVNAAKHWLGVRQRVRWRAPTDVVDVSAKTTMTTQQISADATPEQAADMYKKMLG
jgi:hypothetical protein